MKVALGRRGVLVALVAAMAASLLALGLPDEAFPQATEEQVITSEGPLTSIAIANDLTCQVDHEDNGVGGEFYKGERSALDPATSCVARRR